MTYPYVAVLYEHEPQQQEQEQQKDEKGSDKGRTFTAVRYNLFGGQVRSTFRLGQVDKGAARNPFASFG